MFLLDLLFISFFRLIFAYIHDFFILWSIIKSEEAIKGLCLFTIF